MVKLINPKNGLALRAGHDCLRDASGSRFPVVRGIPRICDPDNYASNFGVQWNKFDRTQLDLSTEGLALNCDRLFKETGWSARDLAGQDILEVGSGAGRFTRVLLAETQARVWSVDYSDAVDAHQ